jgi:acylphosphatase
VISTLPKLWIPLSGDGVTIDLNADSDVDAIKRLVTTFHDIPDAPIKSFTLNINGGRHGILTVSGKPGTCDRSKTFDSRLDGQNGSTVDSVGAVSVEGCKPTVTKSSASRKGLTVRVNNLGAGKVTVSGAGLAKTSRKLKSATEASITARWTKARAAKLPRGKSLKVKLTVTYRPTRGATVKSTKTVTVRVPK